MNLSRIRYLGLLSISLPLCACNSNSGQPASAVHRVAVADVQAQAVTLTQRYVCRIQSHHHIQIRTPEKGIVAAVAVAEGQAVQTGDLLFRVGASPDKERPGAGDAQSTVSIRAPFAGIVDRLLHQEGSPVQQGDTLTTLSDNSLMSVYFNVPDVRSFADKLARPDEQEGDLKFELVLADGKSFDQPGKLAAIGSEFNSQTGTIAVRADFPNPGDRLRHGQAGTLLVSRVLHEAVVVPQRATFEILGKRFVYVVDKNDVAHRREIAVQNESDDMFVVDSGLAVNERIVVEGFQQIQDGDKLEYQDRQPRSVALAPRR